MLAFHDPIKRCIRQEITICRVINQVCPEILQPEIADSSKLVIKKATRQQFYGMLTGSVIIDSAQTDNHHIYNAKVMLFVSKNK
jgi:hypothetical protein